MKHFIFAIAILTSASFGLAQTWTPLNGLVEDGPVHLRIFNTLGQEVATLVSGYQSRGWKSVDYDASHLPSGIYFYRLDTGGFVSIKKMTLIK